MGRALVNVFPEIYLQRAVSTEDPIGHCIVTLARPLVRSLEDNDFTCLNYGFMKSLGAAGQALYMRPSALKSPGARLQPADEHDQKR